jgi:hypothetical protein
MCAQNHNEESAQCLLEVTGSDMPPLTQLLTIKELSAKSRYSVVQLRRLARARRIPFVQPAGPGGKLWFPADALERAGDAAQPAGAEPSEVNPLPGPKPKWRRT